MQADTNRERWPQIAAFVDALRLAFGFDQVHVLQVSDSNGVYTNSRLVAQYQAAEKQLKIDKALLLDLAAAGISAAGRHLARLNGQPVAVPVTPPLCAMGGTVTYKTSVMGGTHKTKTWYPHAD